MHARTNTLGRFVPIPVGTHTGRVGGLIVISKFRVHDNNMP